MKRQVTLQFPSLSNLKAFQLNINLLFFEINGTEKTLRCACTEEQIKLAKSKFNAVATELKKEGKRTVALQVPRFAERNRVN